MKTRRVFAFLLALSLALSLVVQIASAETHPVNKPSFPSFEEWLEITLAWGLNADILPTATEASALQEIAQQLSDPDQYFTQIDDPALKESQYESMMKEFINSMGNMTTFSGYEAAKRLLLIIGYSKGKDELSESSYSTADVLLLLGDTMDNLYLVDTENTEPALLMIGNFTRVGAEIKTGGADEKTLKGYAYFDADQSVTDIGNAPFLLYNGAGGVVGTIDNPWENGDFRLKTEEDPSLTFEQFEAQRRAAQIDTTDGAASIVGLNKGDLATLFEGRDGGLNDLLSSGDAELTLITKERVQGIGDNCVGCGATLTHDNIIYHPLLDCGVHCLLQTASKGFVRHKKCDGCGEFPCISRHSMHALNCGIHYACLGVPNSQEHRDECTGCENYLCACTCNTETDADGNCVFCGVAVTAANWVAHAKRGCGEHCQAQVKDAEGVTLVHKKCNGCKKFMCVARGHHALSCNIHYVCLGARDSSNHTTKCLSGDHFRCVGCVCTKTRPAPPVPPPPPTTCPNCPHAEHLPAACTVSGCLCSRSTSVCSVCGHEAHQTNCKVIVGGKPCGCTHTSP